MSNQLPNQFSNQYGHAPGQAPMAPKSSSKTLIYILVGVFGLGGLMCCGVLAGLLLPAIQAARQAAQRMTASSNVRQIGIALLNYEYTYKQLPPAYTVDANGKKLHSWRTLILPYLEEGRLYESIDFTKPWDAPENSAARNRTLKYFESPGVALPPGHTLYQVVVDPQAIFTGPRPTRLADITDGTTNTLLVVEANKSQSVHWMDPSDLDLNTLLSASPDDTAYWRGRNVVMCDGASRFFAIDLPTEVLKSTITKGGGETIPYLSE